MDEQLYILNIDNLNAATAENKEKALAALESGQVVYLPSYYYSSGSEQEQDLLSDTILDGKHKNISYDYLTNRLGGYAKQHRNQTLPLLLKSFMHDFAEYSRQLIEVLLPRYSKHLIWGRTSYRPAEIKGRSSSKRKDDTRVHVDSFPATPVNGHRILRIFCNINPYGEPRIWHLGEPFADVFARFLPNIPNYNPALAKLLQLIKVTKTLRTAYDHYQLQLHDQMKLNDDYQRSVNKQQIDFQAHSTWLVFTDHVSHAALSGQFLLEQTFYLPVFAMKDIELSPLSYWEKEKEKALA